MRIKRFLAIILSFTVAASCDLAPEDRATSLEADVAAISTFHAEWIAAETSGELESFMALWSDDGVMMPPNIPTLIADTHATVNEVRAGWLVFTQVLQRRVHHVLDAARKLRGPQDDSHLGLQLELIAPVQVLDSPGVDTPVGPEVLSTSQQGGVAACLSVVEVLHIRNRETSGDGQRDKVDVAGERTGRQVAVSLVIGLADAVVLDHRVGAPVHSDGHRLAHTVAIVDVLASVQSDHALTYICGQALVGVVLARPASGQLFPQLRPHYPHPLHRHQAGVFRQ